MRRKEEHVVDVAELPALPLGWQWSHLEEVAANEQTLLSMAVRVEP